MQIPALELTDALMEARLFVREATVDLELLIENHGTGDPLSAEPRVAMQTADRAIMHLQEAQEKLGSLYGTIQEARRQQAPDDALDRSARPLT